MYDGFMDTADGIFSGRTRERKLEIMQDSHVGTNAVIGAIILILAKVTLLGSFTPAVLGPLLVTMYVATRTLMVIYILKFPNARPGGLGEMFKADGKPVYLILALVFCAALLFWMGLFFCKLALVSCVPCIALAFYLKWGLGGLTGDTFGFLTECGNVFVLFLADVLLQILTRSRDFLGVHENLQNVLVLLETDGAQQSGNGQLLLTVDVSVHHIVDVRCKLNPRALEGDDAG